MALNSTKICLAALLLAAIPTSPALTSCLAKPQLPAEWAPWTAPAPTPADSVLSPGKAYKIALAPVAEVDLIGFDGKELPEGSRGVMLTIAVPRDGTYRVTVADPMWIDLIGPEGPNSAVVESIAHGHGPDCSGLGKIVDFPLKQGNYRLELSAAEVPASAVMVLGPTG